MADWVTLTVELEGCERIDCRTELKWRELYVNDERMIRDRLRSEIDDLARRAQELIESRGCGRKA